MGLARYLSALLVLGCARAAQPEAQPPVEAPLRDLPWGQLNFLHSTDTHGWLAGHLQEPQYGADWGDYVSFAQRLREKTDAEGTDLLLVDTGDRVEGNGLYDASVPKGKYSRDIYKYQDIDIMTTGNHELYRAETSYYEYHEQVKNFEGSYIASNLDYIKDDGTQVPMAQRFKKFTTKNQGIRIIAFGFIFDFNMNSNRTVVQKVGDTMKEEWFQEAIRDPDVDLFVVAGHVALTQLEYKTIFDTIRKQRWDMPIQFFAGHAHVRGYREFDDKAHAIASGRYFETIGFQSITGLSSGKGAPAASTPEFGRRYIDNNLYSYHHHSGRNASTFATDSGAEASRAITSARHWLGLDKRYGCVPRTLWLSRAPYPSEDSIFSWLAQRVFPEAVAQPARADRPRIILGNTGAMRFDLFAGPFTRDSTFTLSPFPGGFRFIPDVPYDLADRLLEYLNNQDRIFASGLAHGPLAAPAPQTLGSTRRTSRVHAELKRDVVVEQVPLQADDDDDDGDGDGDGDGGDGGDGGGDGDGDGDGGDDEPELIPGYTTSDSMGADGDDTEHSAIEFFAVPNVFESRVGTLVDGPDGEPVPVEAVDVVFLEFVQPFVLEALTFFGAEYNASDTRQYLDTDLNEILTDWVSENWPGEC